MGYRVVANVCENYGPLKGLEGPFSMGGRVLYYDPYEGRYYDPRSDFYLGQDEVDEIHASLVQVLAK
jgi:hypothetical protein